ncbi:MAG: hypothetical protein QF449_10925 [Alphaproteobacteria bacterium]|jgi:hypothetical protein|nr:hypothetical protein [Alphaproteobacteria bacterium]MDP6590687.1 hypothetical protein [Alphaproteobacteria bacterium]MDP6818536.1 hypothetical protein [Alphaproteobacteria bacterium]|tara:strand:+ start:185 stop:919 length:735 start_codon:yes stop_codon:yes gene_type:complete
MNDSPDWLTIGENMVGPLLRDTSVRLESYSGPEIHIAQLPTIALIHFAHSLQTSIDANQQGRHAVAIALLRHCVESLTIIELGLTDAKFSYPLLEKWHSGKKSQGKLRQELERRIWPRYGTGLWEKTWTDHLARLAKAVQPYAHFSPELIQWNFEVLSSYSSGRFLTTFGPGTYDATKASRLTVFHIIASWTLGRILHANGPPPDALVSPEDIVDLGFALADCEFLIEGEDWSVQFWPHMFFKR